MNTRQHHTTDRASARKSLIRVDEICDAFEVAWRSGRQPKIETYLTDGDETYRDELLTELLLSEWELGELAGQAIDIEHYLERFRDDEQWINTLYRQCKSAKTVFADGEIHTDRDDTSTSLGLSIRCPNCHEMIRLVADSSFAEVICPDCDYQFNLTDVGTATHEATRLETVGHFELIERLGIGAFGSVWKARDTQLDRTVAVKIPRNGRLDPDEIDRFLREARIAAQLRHPNILSVHEVGCDGETVYIVSDVIRGISLADWLSCQRMTAREAAELCVKLSDALHHAHQAGVIHRDLKPQNVMLDSDHEPHLMDFGLARRDVGEVTMTMEGHILGTPAYMAPEQARGESHGADHRCDLYSLGVVLFELLTGERPFRGDPRMILQQVLNDEPPNPRKLNSHIPRDLETICLKCLAKEPEQRYESARQVGEELRRYLDGRPIHARPISSVARVARSCRRNPVLSSLYAVAFTLALILAIGGPFAVVRQARLAAANRHQLYTSNMELAMEACLRGELDVVESLLAQHAQSDLRGFEWYYLRQRLHAADSGQVVELSGSIGEIAVLSRRRLAVSHGPAISFVDLTQYQAALQFSLEHACETIRVSPQDREILAAGSQDGTLRLYHPNGGEPDILFDYSDSNAFPGQTAFSPDGSQLAIALWEDAYGDWIEIWDPKLRELRTKITPSTIHAINDLCFSSDNRLLLSSDFVGKQICIWSVADGKLLESLPMSMGVWTARFLPSDERIVGGCADGRLVAWDRRSGRLTDSVKAHDLRITCTDLSPDGHIIVTGGDDNMIKVWELDDREQFRLLRVFMGRSPVKAVVLLRGESTVVSGHMDGQLRFWDLNNTGNREVLRGHTNIVRCVDVSPDGRLVASGGVDQTLRIWDLQTGNVHVCREHSASVRELAFSPDGTLIATAGWDHKVILWSVADRQVDRVLADFDVPVWEVEFSRDGKYVIAVGWGLLGERNRITMVWEVDSGRRVEVRSDDPSAAPFASQLSPTVNKHILATSDSGRWQAQRHDEVVRLYDVDRNKVLWSIPFGRKMDWAFYPDGNTLAYCEDNVIRLVDLKTGRRRATLRGHDHRIWDLAISSDGQMLISGSEDQTIRVWRAPMDEY